MHAKDLGTCKLPLLFMVCVTEAVNCLHKAIEIYTDMVSSDRQVKSPPDLCP